MIEPDICLDIDQREIRNEGPRLCADARIHARSSSLRSARKGVRFPVSPNKKRPP